jgi:TP901 family phage tail tape measure protein
VTAQPIEANVVLTSDNSQYDRAMTTSAGNTDQLGMAVDGLGRKINNLSKTAGKTLIGISAADVATITGATAAWSSYEKQMSRLQAQSAILTRTNSQQTTVMKDYTSAVKGLRTEYGATTSEAAKLVEVLSKVTDIRQSRDLKDLSKVFEDMSHATGESSEGLATSLTNLQRVMGAPINSKNTRQFADQFTYLAAHTQTSAQGLIDFTAQLAPTAKAMGMTNNQVAGFATAFAKAGQDSGAAATVFSKITTDITHSMQTGSPEIAHYANMLGVTQKAFKQMGAGEQVVEILEKLHSEGKGAAAELARLGLDGPRSIRAIQAIIGSGGLRQSMALTTQGKGAAAEGAAASTRGMSDEISKLNQNFQQLAETMGGYFGPILEKFLQGMNKAMEVVNKIAEGPMGKFLGLVMGIVAPLAAGAGMLLLFAGALMKVAAAFTLFRSSAAYGVREGFAGGGPLGQGAGTRGQQLEQRGTWFQRAQYTGGQVAGSLAGSGLGAIRSGYERARGWADPNYTPGPPRSALSYMAGGLGRGIDMFLTPGFDQMRYADPTKRERSRFFQRSPMGMSEAVAESAANADAARERARTAGAVYQSRLAASPSDPATEQARRDMHRANQEAISSTRASMTAQKEQVATIKSLNQETGNTTTGFRRLAQAAGGFAAGAGGGVLGAGRAGFGAFMRSGAAGPMAAMGTMAGASALGVNSQMVMMGATGAMIGSMIPGVGTAIGAGVGTVAGAGIDMARQNDATMQNLTDLNTSIKDGGSNFTQFSSDINDSRVGMNKWFGALGFGKEAPKYESPLAKGNFLDFESTKNAIKGFFGTSDVEDAQHKYDDAVKEFDSKRTAAADIAKKYGQKLTGTQAQQTNQLTQFMSDRGEGLLSQAGVSWDQLVAAQQKGGPEYTAMLRKILVPQAAEQMLAGQSTTAAGRAMAASPAARISAVQQENVGAYYQGTNQAYDRLRRKGMTDEQIIRSAEREQANIGDENSRPYELQMALSAKAQQNVQMQMPFMGRAQQFQTNVTQLQNLEAIPTTGMTQEQLTQLETQKATTAQSFVDQGQYFKQMLLMQDQFEIQRTRSQQDYSLQRSYQEHDFQLQRSRAESSFARQQNYATADYYRSVRRAHYDFNLQRKRSEDDFQHSIEVQAKQMATTVYDIYQRVQVQRTSSASQILSNAADQLQRMRQQESDLNKLRGMGASDAMIQQMKFTDPANQQQLARFLTEATPRVIKQFNRVAGSLREGAAKNLLQDPSSLDWSETQRSHRLQLARSRQDFTRQMELGHEDFLRALHRQRKEFNIVMDQQAQDYDTQMGRQADAYALSMQRSAQDLANVGKEIDGNFESILVQATHKLTGHAATQADAVLKSFRTLKGSTSAEAIATMQDLASIFGFKYKVPKSVSNNQAPDTRGTQDMSMHGTGGHTVGGMASGGVVPGWTPGRDTTMVPLSGGEAIMRPEWARAMGEGYINAANHAAKHGGYADGGLVNPDARVYMDGEPVSKITKAQLLLAEHLSRMNLTTMQGSWQPYTAYSGSSHMGPGVVDESPGNFRTQYWLRRVGFAAWGRNFPGAATAGSGAHVHAVSLLDPGAAHQSQIAAFYAGQDGLGGLDYGPNPGMIPGLRGMLGQFAALASVRDAHQAGAAATPRLASILKHRYPHSEAAAAAMQGVHPLFPGDISHVMNELVRKRYAESLEGVNPNKTHSWFANGGVFTGPRAIGVGEGGPEAVIPLNDQGANFLAMAMHGAEARGIGMGSSPMRGGVSVYNTRIDKSTNFTGPITVQANDPNELLAKLQARQRVMALSRPSLTGSAA